MSTAWRTCSFTSNDPDDTIDSRAIGCVTSIPRPKTQVGNSICPTAAKTVGHRMHFIVQVGIISQSVQTNNPVGRGG